MGRGDGAEGARGGGRHFELGKRIMIMNFDEEKVKRKMELEKMLGRNC